MPDDDPEIGLGYLWRTVSGSSLHLWIKSTKKKSSGSDCFLRTV